MSCEHNFLGSAPCEHCGLDVGDYMTIVCAECRDVACDEKLAAEFAAVRAEARAEMLAEVVAWLQKREDELSRCERDYDDADHVHDLKNEIERHFAPAAGAGTPMCAHEDCDLDPAPTGDGLCDAHERQRDQELERFGDQRKAQP